ncbi:MAG: hypothetical protein WAU07_00430 [Microgenomates group bacterium]
MPPSSKATSRIVRKERKKVVRQTLLILFVTVLVILGFIFVVIPGFIRIANSVLDTSNPFFETDDIPPQVPTLSAPPAGTNQESLTIEGFGEAGSDVFVIVNGERSEPIRASEDGSFAHEIRLSEGENSISAFGKDLAENESAVSRSFTSVLDTKVPTLMLEDFDQGQEFVSRSNQNRILNGITEPEAKLYVNGRLVRPDSEGAFKTTVILSEGENKVTFKVEDIGGNVYEEERTVTFRL